MPRVFQKIIFSKKNNYLVVIPNLNEGSELKKLIKKIEDGYDFVQGSRFVKGGKELYTPLLRIFAIRFIHAPILSFFSGFKWIDTTQGFRCYKNILFKDSNLDIFRNVFKKYELLAYLNYKVPLLNYRCVEIPTNRIYKKNLGTQNSKIKGVFGYWVIFKTLLYGLFGSL